MIEIPARGRARSHPDAYRLAAWRRAAVAVARLELPIKLIGTLVLPGGLAPAALLELGDRSSCPLSTAGAGDASCVIGPTYAWVHPGPAAFNHVFGALVFLAVLLAPIVAAGWLALRLRWTSTGHRSDPGPQRGARVVPSDRDVAPAEVDQSGHSQDQSDYRGHQQLPGVGPLLGRDDLRTGSVVVGTQVAQELQAVAR